MEEMPGGVVEAATNDAGATPNDHSVDYRLGGRPDWSAYYHLPFLLGWFAILRSAPEDLEFILGTHGEEGAYTQRIALSIPSLTSSHASSSLSSTLTFSVPATWIPLPEPTEGGLRRPKRILAPHQPAAGGGAQLEDQISVQ
jgi:hypothetical protein